MRRSERGRSERRTGSGPERSRLHHRRAGRRGVSLVEVLVVLVILVLGMFSITRLFPEGFASLGHTGSATLASALIQRREEYLRKNRASLPDVIAAVDRATGQILTTIQPQEFLGALPYVDNPIAGYTGTPPDDPRDTGVNRARRVLGETVKIPPPTTGYGPNGETLSLYHLMFSPIYSAAPAGSRSQGVRVYGGTPLQRVVFQDPPTGSPTGSPPGGNWADLRRLGPFGYGIYYETDPSANSILYFEPVPYPRVYRIEFTYHTGPGQALQSPPGLTVTVPANATQVPVPAPAGAVVDIGSEVLYREFNQIAPGAAFSADPFEFKVLDNLFGLIGFHPLLSSLPLPHSEGRGLTARVDYDVDDWHIVWEDVVVPSQPQGPLAVYPIRLATGPIKKLGEVEDTINFDPNSPGGGAVNATLEYLGLVRYYPAGPNSPARPGTPGVDLVIVDQQTGYRIDSRTLQPGGPNGEIDYEAGVIYLRSQAAGGQPPVWDPPSNLGGAPIQMDPGGRHVRVYYRAYNDIGVACAKPYSIYRMDPLLTNQPQVYTPFPGGYLLFANADAEKTVSIDYTYLTPSMGGMTPASRVMAEVGELQQLQPPGAPGAPPPARWWVRVARANDPAVDPATIRIRAVRGASFHTRAVWREGRRWRHALHTTILTRSPSR